MGGGVGGLLEVLLLVGYWRCCCWWATGSAAVGGLLEVLLCGSEGRLKKPMNRFKTENGVKVTAGKSGEATERGDDGLVV